MSMKTYRVEKRTMKIIREYVTVRAHSEDEAVEEARHGFGQPYDRPTPFRFPHEVESTPDPDPVHYEALDMAVDEAQQREEWAREKLEAEEAERTAAQRQRQRENEEVARRARETAEKAELVRAQLVERARQSD